jgi:hypothetical protein
VANGAVGFGFVSGHDFSRAERNQLESGAFAPAANHIRAKVMVDYAKLLDEEKARRDSAIANAEAQRRREIELVAFFRSVEIAVGQEMAKANQELKRRGAPPIEGPFRPGKLGHAGEEQIELTFGNRRPACRLTLESIARQIGLSRMKVELLDDAHHLVGSMHYLLEGEAADVKAYKPLVEGFPDRGAILSPDEMAQEIVPSIIRGRFA